MQIDLKRHGFTIVELMVTVLIVAILATTLAVFFVQLLTIQEKEREEAYVCERLSDICANYADYLSVATSISKLSTNEQMIIVKYREETGGVSLETGRVSRVTRFVSNNKRLDLTGESMVLDLKIGSIQGEDFNKNFVSRFSRLLRGDAELISLAVDRVCCVITPLNVSSRWEEKDEGLGILETTDAVLANLCVAAWYRVENREGSFESKTAVVERVVRLWNQK